MSRRMRLQSGRPQPNPVLPPAAMNNARNLLTGGLRYASCFLAGCAVFLLVFVVVSPLPHSLWLHEILPLVVGAAYGLVVASNFAQQAKDTGEENLMPLEVVWHSTRQHSIIRYLGWFVRATGALIVLYAFYLWYGNSGFQVPWAHYNVSTDQANYGEPSFSRGHKTLHFWYPVALIGIAVLISSALITQRWRYFWLVQTNQRLIEWQEMSPWLPYPIEQDFDQEMANQIVDVDEKVGFFGKKFGWGGTKVKIRSTQGTDQVKVKPYHLIPNSHLFAQYARLASPILNAQLRGEGITLDPLAIPPGGFPQPSSQPPQSGNWEPQQPQQPQPPQGYPQGQYPPQQ